MTARRQTTAIAMAIATVLVLGAVAPAAATVNQRGDVRASFDGGLRPTVLPRAAAAPVAVSVSGGVRSAPGSGAELPQLRRITVAINRQGQLYDRGLAVCRARQIQPATAAAARRICGEALVGHGVVDVQVRIPGQLPFAVHAQLLAFNGPRRHGQRLIVAHVYAGKPPGSFSLIFAISHRAGTFGTVLSTTLPPPTRAWAYLTHFEMTLRRTYVYQGQRRSYVAAACSAPNGFLTATFPFAKATYAFVGGSRLSMSVAKTCRVAGGGA